MASAILDGIADGLKAWWPGLRIGIDLDTLPALSEDRERLWRQVSAADFLTLDEKRAMVGVGPVAQEAVQTEGDAPEAEDDDAATEVKFNPWHDPEDGRFTFAGAGVRYGGGHDGPPSVARRVAIRHSHSISTGAPKPLKGSALAPRRTKKQRAVDAHFSPSVSPTIDNAIAQIKVSTFGKTKAGKYVIDKVERLHRAGKISIEDLGTTTRGKRTPDGRIVVSTGMADNVRKIASELVHEATHDLLSDEYRRTGRQPNGNSIEQETLTNGYQLQLYRQQRKYGFFDRELERRLKESNRGKLRSDIRRRYPQISEAQPAR